jgi:fructose-specific PTS system IIA-like component
MPLLLGLGVDELSVGAARVGTVRAWTRALEHATVQQLAGRALEADSAAEVEHLLRPLSQRLSEGGAPSVQAAGATGLLATATEARPDRLLGTAMKW